MSNIYFIHEANLERLTKKVNSIINKCKKYNQEFTFNIFEDQAEYRDFTTEDKQTIKIKYIPVEVEGVVKHNDWEFVGTVDYHETGNVIRQYLTEITVPERFRHTDRTCEHCNKIRSRKATYIVHNTVTDEFKQVGGTCLNEFTNGLDAEAVAQYISLFDQLIKGEAVDGSGHIERYHEINEWIRYAYECVKHFGYEKKWEYAERTTVGRATEYHQVRGSISSAFMPSKVREKLEQEMEDVNFNPDSEEAIQFAKDAINWIRNLEDTSNQYLYNLKTVCSEDYIAGKDLGILVSLVPTYMREIEQEVKKAERAKAHEADKVSEYQGKEGDKLEFKVNTITCVYSSENQYGYTYMYKITDESGNVYMWSTSNGLDLDKVASIKGTVKNHQEYNGVKQTWITRCKITEKPADEAVSKVNKDDLEKTLEMLGW